MIRELVSGTLRVDPEVAKPGHPMHGSAVTAIQRLDAVIKEPTFAHDASLSLFPPQQPQPEIEGEDVTELYQAKADSFVQPSFSGETPAVITRTHGSGQPLRRWRSR